MAKKSGKANTAHPAQPLTTEPPRRVFVIMPFRPTATRNKQQLTAFFKDRIKRPIERSRLRSRYIVHRSDDAFNITEQIIKDLYASDVVICDLSGRDASPNVMYELGVRLGVSSKPVILIREQHKNNKPIFDVSGFYTYSYDSTRYTALTRYLINKLRRIEDGKDPYTSPVFKVLGDDLPLIQRVSSERAAVLLHSLCEAIRGVLRVYAGVVGQFVGERAGIRFDRAAELLDLDLADNDQHLRSLNWNELRFALNNSPGISAYIAAPFLHGVLEDYPDIEIRFLLHVVEYNTTFHATNVFWDTPNLATCTSFARETRVLIAMCVALVAMLMERTDEGMRAHRDRFDTVAHESEFYNQIDGMMTHPETYRGDR